MCIAYWITKAKNTHSEYVILLSTATVVARTRLDVTLHAYCLSCSGITQDKVLEGLAANISRFFHALILS
jgi:alkylhydroperoxidase family enzyme